MLGSLLKCKMRSGALEGRIFGSKDEYMKGMLEEIEDDTNIEDLVFENKDDAFCWLKSCIEKANDRYSRKFISIELIWVADEAIPRNLVNEKRCSKIKGIKNIILQQLFKAKLECLCGIHHVLIAQTV